MKTIKFALGFSIITLILILIACQPEAKPGEPLKAIQIPQASLLKESWELEWEKTLSLARKEGKIVVYTNWDPRRRELPSEIIKDKFSITPEWVAAPGGVYVAKVITEARAGLYLADIIVGGIDSILAGAKPAGLLTPLQPLLILPEVLNPEIWWRGRIPFIDKEKTIISSMAALSVSMFINTNLVKEGEIKSYYDLLEPKWKGKIVMEDPTVPGKSRFDMVMVGTRIINFDYVQQLADTRPVIAQGRLAAEWLAQGKFAVAFGIGMGTIDPFIEAGAPLKPLFPIEGSYVNSGGANIAQPVNVPHPNAAKLFINWFLTKEGQTTYSKADRGESARLDVPTDHIPVDRLRKKGLEYPVKEDEELLLKANEYYDRVKKIFGPLVQ